MDAHVRDAFSALLTEALQLAAVTYGTSNDKLAPLVNVFHFHLKKYI